MQKNTKIVNHMVLSAPHRHPINPELMHPWRSPRLPELVSRFAHHLNLDIAVTVHRMLYVSSLERRPP